MDLSTVNPFCSSSSGQGFLTLVENRSSLVLENLVSLGFPAEKAAWLLTLGYTLEGVKERLDGGFTPEEVINAVTVKLLHDKVEIAAYEALQKAVVDLALTRKFKATSLSQEESKKILHQYIRAAAHRVMRAPDGYMNVRMHYLNQRQIAPVIGKVEVIVTDRDSKLTHATYKTFEELEGALDAHNTLVNGILFDAWGVPKRPGICHLTEIKAKAGYSGPVEERLAGSDPEGGEESSKRLRMTNPSDENPRQKRD